MQGARFLKNMSVETHLSAHEPSTSFIVHGTHGKAGLLEDLFSLQKRSCNMLRNATMCIYVSYVSKCNI